MAKISNNMVSRNILVYLNESYPKAIKFSEMVKSLDFNERDLFKNLFFLEENSLVQLMSSYPTGATYPTIHMIKIRDEGKNLLGSEERLNNLFPLNETSGKPDFYQINSLSLSEIMGELLVMIEENSLLVKKDRNILLENIKSASLNPAISGVKLIKIFERLA